MARRQGNQLETRDFDQQRRNTKDFVPWKRMISVRLEQDRKYFRYVTNAKSFDSLDQNLLDLTVLNAKSLHRPRTSSPRTCSLPSKLKTQNWHPLKTGTH
jgi:hypothetical protein